MSYPLGAEPEGIIMYTPDGYMSAQLMARGRGLYSDRDPHMANTDELAQPAACYLSATADLSQSNARWWRTTCRPVSCPTGSVKRNTGQRNSTPPIHSRSAPTEPALMGGKLHNSTLVWPRP